MTDVSERFFPHVTDDENPEKYKAWLRKQTTEDLEEFLAVENLTHFDHQLELMRLELRRRRAAAEQHSDRLRFWLQHAISAAIGAGLVLLAQFLAN